MPAEVAQPSQAQTPSTQSSQTVPQTVSTPKTLGDHFADAKKSLGRQSRTQPELVPTLDDVFSFLNEKVEQMPDYSNTQGFDPWGKPVDTSEVKGAELAQDAMGEMQAANAAKIAEGQALQDQAKPATEEGPLYSFKGKLGEEEFEYDFDNQQELDQILNRGFAADKVFQAYSKMKEQVQDLSMKASKLDAMDELIQNDPLRAMDLVVEDILASGKEDQMKQWMIKMADYLSKSTAEKEQLMKLKEAERYKTQLEAHQRQLKEIEERKHRAIIESEFQQLQGWAKSNFDKYVSKLPEGMGPWLQGQIKDVVALNRSRGNGDVSLEELSRQIASRVRPLLNLSKRKIDAEIGRATEQKKADNVSMTQSVAAKGGVTQSSNKERGIDDFIRSSDVGGLTRFLADKVNQGRLRVLADE